jgi:hypothetical protein
MKFAVDHVDWLKHSKVDMGVGYTDTETHGQKGDLIRLLLFFFQNNGISLIWFVFYLCCSHLKHEPSVKCFVSLQFLSLLHRRQDSSDGRSARQKTAEQMQTDIHVLSEIRTHNPSLQATEDISCLRPLSHCDRQANKCVL